MYLGHFCWRQFPVHLVLLGRVFKLKLEGGEKRGGWRRWGKGGERRREEDGRREGRRQRKEGRRERREGRREREWGKRKMGKERRKCRETRGG